MPVEIEAVEGRNLELWDEAGNVSTPGKSVILCDDQLYRAGAIDLSGQRPSEFDEVCGYSTSGAHVNGEELEPGKIMDGKSPNIDLKYKALYSHAKELVLVR